MEQLVAERQALQDPIHVGRMHPGRPAQAAPALRTLGLKQVALARARAQDLSAGRNLKTFGHGLLGFDTFRTSHK